MKICNRCKKSKLLKEFALAKSNPDGLQYTCKVCCAEIAKIYRTNNPEKVKELNKNRSKSYLKSRREYRKSRQKRIRKEVIKNLGGVCACCGEKQIEFLTIDHINNDGAEHRRKIGNSDKICVDIKRQGYPKDKYQILCFNCNCAKGIYGSCPHKH
jgi:hypothetical protein